MSRGKRNEMKVLQLESDLLEPSYKCVILRDMEAVREFMDVEAAEAGIYTDDAIAQATITEIEMDEAEFEALEPYDP